MINSLEAPCPKDDLTILDSEAENAKCFPISGPEVGKECHFPFVYKENTYWECTDKDHDQKWCSTEVYNVKEHINGMYGNCGNECTSGKFQNHIFLQWCWTQFG